VSAVVVDRKKSEPNPGPALQLIARAEAAHNGTDVANLPPLMVQAVQKTELSTEHGQTKIVDKARKADTAQVAGRLCCFTARD
jgi:hypothetical protein